MNVQGIDVIFIHVKNPNKMLKWYSKILGVPFKNFPKDSFWQECVFTQYDKQTRFALDFVATAASEVEQQPIMISFLVEDLSKAVQGLEDKGIKFVGKEKTCRKASSAKRCPYRQETRTTAGRI